MTSSTTAGAAKLALALAAVATLDESPHRRQRSLPKAHGTANQKAAAKRKRNRKNPQHRGHR